MGGVGEFVLADVQNGLELEMQSQEINNDDNITSNKIGGHGCRLMQIQAEQILADMEFGPSDHPSERALKLDVVRIYNAKLDERERRKRFVIERGLVDYRRTQSEGKARRGQSAPGVQTADRQTVTCCAPFHLKFNTMGKMMHPPHLTLPTYYIVFA